VVVAGGLVDPGIVYERPVALTPPGEPVLGARIRRITQNNPGMFPGPGTNTYLVGPAPDGNADGDQQPVIILEPGEDDEAHFESIVAAVGEATVSAIVPSHAHRDHWPLAARLAERFSAPTLGLENHLGYVPDQTMSDGQKLEVGSLELEVLHTPGHCSDHTCLLLGSRVPGEDKLIFSGDLVMGWSTSVIMPPDGSLNDYMASLERLMALEPQRMLSAHGLVIADPMARINELYEHRKMRTVQALAALANGPASIRSMVREIYADIDSKLYPAAEMSLLAHMEALAAEGRVQIDQDSSDRMTVLYRL
jgi:hydroxyacylglutathione hydrolase